MRTFIRLLGFLRPYRTGVIASLVLAAFAMAGTVAIPALTGRAIDQIREGNRGGLETLIWVMLGVGGVRLIFSVARRLVAGKVSLGVEVDLREALYGHLQRLELGFFDGQQTGQLMSRVTIDLQAVRFFLGYGLVFIAQSVLTIGLAAIAMFLTKPGLAALALVPVPFVVWASTRYTQRARPTLQRVQQRIAELTADVEENVSGVRVVKAFAREDRQLEAFRGSTAAVFDESMVANRQRAFYNPFLGFLPQIGLAVVLLVGGQQVVEGSLTLGEFTAFYAYVLMLVAPMRQLGIALGMGQRSTASGARIFELLDRAPELSSPANAQPLPPGGGRVELRGVTLTYPGTTHPALVDVDLDVPAGATLAVVGATGSGKSSLVALLSRLYDPEVGTVFVDGADVRTLDLHALRSQVAVVTDDPFLFSATVAENVAYGRPDASREEIELAVARARADGFVAELPDGLDTKVGERGLTLSGGQRQRLAIARALLADPRILVLDDATSSVDASTEREIQAALREVMVGRTTFVIAHRLSSLVSADEIVVLEGGRIAARGTHAELAEGDGLYAEMARRDEAGDSIAEAGAR